MARWLASGPAVGLWLATLLLGEGGAAAAGPDGGAPPPPPPPSMDAGPELESDAGVPSLEGESGAVDGAAAASAETAAAVPTSPGPASTAAVPPLPRGAAAPLRVEELTVVGTRETHTAGSAHVLRPRDLDRLRQENPEAVVKAVPGVYARGEDGFGLRPNIGIRGTSPDRSKKVTLMEDGILFGPAPYSAPAAYYFPQVARMEKVRVIKGPGAISFGPQTVGGAIDFVTRGAPVDESGAIDLTLGAFGYGKVHAYFGGSTGRASYVLEGVHIRTSGFKKLDGGGDTGFEHNEWMWKGKYQLSTNPDAEQEVGLKLGYSDEDSRESYLGLTDADARKTPLRRYRASQLDRMLWHRTQIVGSYHARWRQAFTLDASLYRHDFTRTWRKVNHIGTSAIADVLASPDTAVNSILYNVLTGAEDSSTPGVDTIYIGPNRRLYVSQGLQVAGGWKGKTGPLDHRIEVGARYHYDRIDRLHSEDGFLMQGGALVPDGRPTIVTADQRVWSKALALHLTGATTWGPLTVTPGVRMELISTWSRDRRAGTLIEGSPQRVVIPGIGLYGALTPTLGLLAGVYRGFSPAAPGQPGTVSPETSVNTDVGVRFSPRWMRIEAIGFFNDYRNLTAICTFASGCGANALDTQTDAGRAHIYGLELFARTDAPIAPGIVLPFSAAYTFTRTKLLDAFTSDNDPTLRDVQPGDELPLVPRHQAHVLTGIETRRVDLTLSGTYVSAMREKAGQGPLVGTERLTDASLILDATVRVKVAASGQVYLGVRNLTNAADIAARLPFGARPVAPRWIQVGTRWSF